MTKYKQIVSRLFYTVLLAAAWLQTGPSFAQSGPQPWQMNFRPSATPVMDDIVEFHNLLLVIEVIIVLFVLGLMVYICVKFNAKANPVPSKTTHNSLLEVAWTVIPIIVLIVIAVPSMKLLVFMDKAPKEKVEMTLKVIGHQWYWSYEYPDAGNLAFDSNIIPDEEIDASKGQIRLLEVDNRIAIPVDTTIRVLMTSEDVLHNWAVPAFGIKMDTVPGRINESWIRVPAARAGVYRGQCSELCGVNHGYMPIVIEAKSKQDFAKWLNKAKKEFANDASPVKVVRKDTIVR
ncbi:MAG TPA: cytochrome c oxidase subunit II [Rhodospirillales bacterium]|nr:cytochrome c oxidase subunit II [Rhodospirillales bacterium]HIC60874.1 cytochrome c oxidase subunit II [Rhodospirillales bacterium]